MARWGLLSVAIICLGSARCDGNDPGLPARTVSRNLLREVCKTIWLAEAESKQPAPTDMRKLVGWLGKHAPRNEEHIDYVKGTIRDAWGRDIILVSEGGRLKAVGSAGEDGVWEGGRGDDICVSLEEVR